MSLFGDPCFEYLETYFVLYNAKNHPLGSQVIEAIEKLGAQIEIVERNQRVDTFESATLVAPSDRSGVDIALIDDPEEVAEQVEELAGKFQQMSLSAEERERLDSLQDCDARFDVYHFAERSSDESDSADPSTLFAILQSLGEITNGIAIMDAQSPALI